MIIDINQYLIPLDNLDLTKILSTWTWLTGDKTVVALTKSGDALLRDSAGQLYFLDVGSGILEFKAYNYCNFFDNQLNDELIEEILLPSLVDKLEQHGLRLNIGQVYSYTMLPIIGGAYDEKNMFPLDVYEHFSLTGIIHFQLKDTPDGTRVVIQI